MIRVGEEKGPVNRPIPRTPKKGFPMAMGGSYRAFILKNGTGDKASVLSALKAMGWADSSEIFFSVEDRDQSQSARTYPWPHEATMTPAAWIGVWVEGEWTRPTGFVWGRPYEGGDIQIYKLWYFDPTGTHYIPSKEDPYNSENDPFGIKKMFRDLGDSFGALAPIAVAFFIVKALSKEGRR